MSCFYLKLLLLHAYLALSFSHTHHSLRCEWLKVWDARYENVSGNFICSFVVHNCKYFFVIPGPSSKHDLEFSVLSLVQCWLGAC